MSDLFTGQRSEDMIPACFILFHPSSRTRTSINEELWAYCLSFCTTLDLCQIARTNKQTLRLQKQQLSKPIPLWQTITYGLSDQEPVIRYTMSKVEDASACFIVSWQQLIGILQRQLQWKLQFTL